MIIKVFENDRVLTTLQRTSNSLKNARFFVDFHVVKMELFGASMNRKNARFSRENFSKFGQPWIEKISRSWSRHFRATVVTAIGAWTNRLRGIPTIFAHDAFSRKTSEQIGFGAREVIALDAQQFQFEFFQLVEFYFSGEVHFLFFFTWNLWNFCRLDWTDFSFVFSSYFVRITEMRGYMRDEMRN